MSLMVTDNEIPREKPGTGIHDALFVFIADVGTHITKTQWGPKAQHKVVVCWELAEKMEKGEYAGKPFMISKRYTFTLFQKGNLSKDLESFFGKRMSDETRKNGFDLEALVGRKCILNLVESEDGKYINVGSVLPAHKDNNLVQVCTERPKWIQKLIDASMEKTNATPENGEPLPADDFNQGMAANDQNLPF